MAGAVDRFLSAARALGLEPDIHRFPEGTKTAEAAAAAVGCGIGQIVKSLVFVADETPVVALTSGANRVDPARLGALLGAARVRRADPERAREATGFSIGGSPPFGYPHPLTVLADRDLMAYPELWAAAGTPDAVFPITPPDLMRATGAVVVDLKEGFSGEGRSESIGIIERESPRQES
jgi:prolyl-tRNA editing enzyme YbaK/EbsC (Cys-tRNA(Pro) deacylase)